MVTLTRAIIRLTEGSCGMSQGQDLSLSVAGGARRRVGSAAHSAWGQAHGGRAAAKGLGHVRPMGPWLRALLTQGRVVVSILAPCWQQDSFWDSSSPSRLLAHTPSMLLTMTLACRYSLNPSAIATLVCAWLKIELPHPPQPHYQQPHLPRQWPFPAATPLHQWTRVTCCS